MVEPSKQACPLCGAQVADEGLEGLGRHFRQCPKTASDQRTGRGATKE